jgi:hypothetical protein
LNKTRIKKLGRIKKIRLIKKLLPNKVPKPFPKDLWNHGMGKRAGFAYTNISAKAQLPLSTNNSQ